MRDLKTNKMYFEKKRQAALAIILILVASFAIGATEPSQPLSPSNLLVDKIGNIKATTDIKQLTRETLAELVGDKAAIYQEYRVTSAASREYSGVRIDVFEAQNQFGAFGLFMFNSRLEPPDSKEGASRARPINEKEEIGFNGARDDNELI